MRTIAVAACMKNEGPFIVEWVAHYLAIGFDRLFILTNDCDDGTDLMADRLAALAPVTHIRNIVPKDKYPQAAGMETLKASGHLDRVDWLLHCDADEFLYLYAEDPDIRRFLEGLPPCDVVALDWRLAGTTLERWPGGLVVENCPMGSARPQEGQLFSKAIFRPSEFGAIGDHMPKAPVRPDVVARNCVGAELPTAALFHPKRSRYTPTDEYHSWQAAEMRHYALRARRVFAAKAMRGFGMHPKPTKYRVGSFFWHQANRREVEMEMNPLWLSRLKAGVRRLLSDPELARLHAEAIRIVDAKGGAVREAS